MRIVSGTCGGRILKTPKNDAIRPTSDKIRGAIFNALRARAAVEGAYVLDGFCGTGALGLEALSQGAAHCVFVDSARASLDLARENTRILGLENQAEFILKELAKIGQLHVNDKKFTLLFLDPPYSKNLIHPALQALHEGHLMEPEAVIVLETEKAFAEEFSDTYTLLDSRLYGDTKVTTLRYTGRYTRTPE